MKHLALVLLACACSLQVFSFHPSAAQPDSVGFIISSATVNEGEQFCIDIRLDNFIDMGVMSLDIKWNPYAYQYVSNTGYLINADPISQVVDINALQGNLRVLWIAENLFTGQTEFDSTILVSICFRALSSCGDASLISIDEENIIVSDFNNMDLPVVTYPGEINTTIIGFDVNTGICSDDSSAIGSIHLMMCGGQSPYTINYTGPGSGGSSTINQENGSVMIPNLAAGVYDFFIEDMHGDTLHKKVIVPSGEIHHVESILDLPTCHYSLDGKITLDIEPAAQYQIIWSTVEYAKIVIRNLENGVYTVAVTDQNGCSVADTFELHRQALDIAFEIKADSNGTDSSVLVAHVQGGVKPYVYQWESLPPSLDSIITNFESRLYQLQVIDSLSCFTTDSIDLTRLGNSLIDQQSIDFTLSPVPTSSFLTFNRHLSSSSKGGELVIFDVMGKSRIRQSFAGFDTNVVLDVRALTASQYWLTVWEGGKVVGIAPFQKNN